MVAVPKGKRRRNPVTSADHALRTRFIDLIRYFISASRAFFQNVIDVRFVCQNFLAAFAHRREIFPKFFEKLFLEIAVTCSAF